MKGWGRKGETGHSLNRMAENVTSIAAEESGHWVPEEQPRLVAESIDALLGS